MNETDFEQNNRSKKVVAVSGLRKMWSKSVEASFHMRMIALCSADVFVVTPIFTVPGKWLNRSVVYQFCVPNATFTTMHKGFMNASMFMKWLR